MVKKRKSKRTREEPEIILKQFVHYQDTSRKTLAEPALLLLANREGFRWLSEYFAHLAERDWVTAQQVGADPDDHQHLWLQEPPFNAKLSDTMEIRLGVLTSENRRAVKKQYGITTRSARRDCLTERYREDIEVARRTMTTF